MMAGAPDTWPPAWRTSGRGPAASTPEQVVGELLAVQSQIAAGRLAIAQRADCHVTEVEAAIDAGRIVRTHVLRPTWHYVLRDDLAWLLS